MNFILIDGSYYIFYRYFALVNWWKLSEQDTLPNSEEFINKFREIFINKIKELPKKLKISNNSKPIFLIGKDCPRNQIWRNNIFDVYKTHRINDTNIGKFFKLVYEEKLFEKFADNILFHPNLEADDCIAIAVKEIQSKYSDANIYIITSDLDYLQLANDKIHLYNLQFKNLINSKISTGDPQKDLFCKIIMGDKSDGIPGVFNKCGLKTAIKYYNEPELFKQKLSSSNSEERFKLNTQLINFNYIPSEYKEEFIKNNNLSYENIEIPLKLKIKNKK